MFKPGKLLELFLTLAAAAFLVAPANAHHGFAQYDLSKTITLNGRISSFDWTNPHCLIHIDTKSDNGTPEHWTLELASISTMSRYGWMKNSLKPGDEVTVYAHPAKNGAPIGLIGTNKDKYINPVIVNGKPLPGSITATVPTD